MALKIFTHSFLIVKAFVFMQTMTDKEKQRFYEMAERDKERYDTEMRGYKGPRQSRASRKRRNRKDPNAPKRAL